MKATFIFLISFAPFMLFSQSSATDSFELNLIIDRSIDDFEEIDLYYIAGSTIQSCNYHLDSLDHTPNLTNIKIYGEYTYFGGGNAVYPSFIFAERNGNSIQNYLVKVEFSARKHPELTETDDLLIVQLIPSRPIIELSKHTDQSTFMKNYQFLDELSSTNDNSYYLIDLLTWTKVHADEF